MSKFLLVFEMDFLMSRFFIPILLVSFLSACGGSSDDSDIDGDGVANEVDAFPRDALESVDSDGDGVGNNSDAFPEDETETLDSDLDGVGDNADVFPTNKDETLDSDGDGVGNNSDAFPDDKNETLDSDGDGVGDNGDEFPFDFDNDGTPDLTDMFPQDPNESIDSDGDGVGDNSDAFPNDKNQTTDANCDGFGDNTDVDVIPDDSPGAEIGLGDGVGNAYHAGVAITGLSEGETLSANGSTSVTVHVVEESCDNFAALSPQNIYFTSTCVQLGLAKFTPVMVTANGTATSVYHDMGCGKVAGATDNVVAYLGVDDGSGNVIAMANASAEIDIAPVQVGGIEFLQAMPSTIALKGLGTENTPSLSLVEFQVINEFGNYLPEHIVHFKLDHEYGNAELSSESAITDQDGKVSVFLVAGYATGTVKVIASIDIREVNGDLDYTLTTMSMPISMVSSLGSQDNFTLSSDTLNPDSWSTVGNQVDIVVHLGDHYQNPVVDGTVIYFRTSGGNIDRSCETVNGVCSVKWASSDSKPVDGYVTVLALARGQGDFQDKNGNGIFDLGESYTTLGETWFDVNGNGIYEESGRYQPDLDIDNDGSNEFDWTFVGNFYEEYIDSNDNGEFDQFSNNKYQGINCSEAAKAQGHCAETIDVSASLRLQMSAGNDALIEGPFLMQENGEYDYSQIVSCIDGRSGARKVAWRVADSQQRRNHLPIGTIINYHADNVVVASEKGTGEMPSTPPAPVLSVWEVMPVNVALTPAQRKEKYLNERGSLIEVTIVKPDVIDPSVEYGTINVIVETLDGELRSPATALRVDILGNTCPAP